VEIHYFCLRPKKKVSYWEIGERRLSKL